MLVIRRSGDVRAVGDDIQDDLDDAKDNAAKGSDVRDGADVDADIFARAVQRGPHTVADRAGRVQMQHLRDSAQHIIVQPLHAQLRGAMVDIVVDPRKKAVDAGQLRVVSLDIDAGVRQVQQQVDRQDVGVLHVLRLGKKHLGHVVIYGVDDAAAPPRPAGRKLCGHGCGIQFAPATGVGKVGVGGVDRQRAVVRPRKAVLAVGGRAAVKLAIGIRAAAQPLAQQRQRGLSVSHASISLTNRTALPAAGAHTVGTRGSRRSIPAACAAGLQNAPQSPSATGRRAARSR